MTGVLGSQSMSCVDGHLHLPRFRAAFEREAAEDVIPVVHIDHVSAA
jgi:putative transposase